MNKALNRLTQLLDPHSLELMDDLEPTIHILVKGAISGRPVYCCSGNPDAKGVDIHECFRRKINWLEAILNKPAPVVWLHDFPQQAPGGRTPIPARSDELLASNESGVGRAFCLQARLNGITPQISALFSDAGAAQTFPVRLCDITLLKNGSHMWIGRPDAVKLMLGKAPDPEELGGAQMHCKLSGVGDVLFEQDEEALEWIRTCIENLPSTATAPLPVHPPVPPALSGEQIAAMVPADLNTPFNMRPLLGGILDAGSWMEIQEQYAPEIMTGLCRINGIPAGILANNSVECGGVLYPESCRKMTGFIRFCDTYRIPMLFLADNPGLMVGTATEQAGMLNEATELLRTLAHCRTPRICLVIRKAYTVGLYAMSGPGFDPAEFIATPHASISVFGPKALDYFAADRTIPQAALQAILEMRRHATEPRVYEEKGYLNAVVEWQDLRPHLESAMTKLRQGFAAQGNRK
ncbi:MAG: hypothetical protein KFF50_11720 [Desulfatitalea sp.]|nr:hypothetical protein [Desulfatitalea sp.]